MFTDHQFAFNVSNEQSQTQDCYRGSWIISKEGNRGLVCVSSAFSRPNEGRHHLPPPWARAGCRLPQSVGVPAVETRLRVESAPGWVGCGV